MEFAARLAYFASKMKSAPFLLALLLLSGCTSRAPAPPASPRDAGNLPDKRLIVDPALNGILRIRKVQDMASSLGWLQFQVNVENLSSSAQTVVYQVDWLDKDGISLGLDVEEPPHTLFPTETWPLTMSAPAAVARDFRLTFRPRGH